MLRISLSTGLMDMKNDKYNELELSEEIYSLCEVKRAVEVFSHICRITIVAENNRYLCTINQMFSSTVEKIVDTKEQGGEEAIKKACEITLKEFENYLIRISRNDEVVK